MLNSLIFPSGDKNEDPLTYTVASETSVFS